MFGRATITLGIGPHSSSLVLFLENLCHVWGKKKPKEARANSVSPGKWPLKQVGGLTLG